MTEALAGFRDDVPIQIHIDRLSYQWQSGTTDFGAILSHEPLGFFRIQPARNHSEIDPAEAGRGRRLIRLVSGLCRLKSEDLSPRYPATPNLRSNLLSLPSMLFIAVAVQSPPFAPKP
jgi:hypothetical protein